MENQNYYLKVEKVKCKRCNKEAEGVVQYYRFGYRETVIGYDCRNCGYKQRAEIGGCGKLIEKDLTRSLG